MAQRAYVAPMRIGGPRHDWLRIDDDHFTPIEH
jgi:hypothetical protein